MGMGCESILEKLMEMNKEKSPTKQPFLSRHLSFRKCTRHCESEKPNWDLSQSGTKDVRCEEKIGLSQSIRVVLPILDYDTVKVHC